MELQKLHYDVADGIATITMDYPKNLNAIIIRQTYTIIFMCMSQNCEK